MPGRRLGLRGTDAWNKAGVERSRCLEQGLRGTDAWNKAGVEWNRCLEQGWG